MELPMKVVATTLATTAKRAVEMSVSPWTATHNIAVAAETSVRARNAVSKVSVFAPTGSRYVAPVKIAWISRKTRSIAVRATNPAPTTRRAVEAVAPTRKRASNIAAAAVKRAQPVKSVLTGFASHHVPQMRRCACGPASTSRPMFNIVVLAAKPVVLARSATRELVSAPKVSRRARRAVSIPTTTNLTAEDATRFVLATNFAKREPVSAPKD